jgi:hypothetical protein
MVFVQRASMVSLAMGCNFKGVSLGLVDEVRPRVTHSYGFRTCYQKGMLTTTTGLRRDIEAVDEMFKLRVHSITAAVKDSPTDRRMLTQ